MKLGKGPLTACFALALLLPTLFSTQPTHAQNGWNALGSVPDGAWRIAPDPANASAMYALNSSGVSRTTDGGATWAVCSPGATMMKLVSPAPGQSSVGQLYATTPSGLRVSTDGCQSWRDTGTQGLNPSASHVRRLAAYPDNTSVLYAGMDGLGGLYRSTDAGATWQSASSGLPPNAWLTAFTADAKSPSVVFAGLEYTTRAHPPAYVYRSTDGGLTWRSSSLGLHILPNNGGSIVGLSWSGPNLFAATSTDGLYKSADRGVSWFPATLPRRTGIDPATAANTMPLSITSLAAGQDGTLLLGTAQGAYQSLDGGSTWTAFGPAQSGGKPALLALEPSSGRVALASDGKGWGYKMPAGSATLPQVTNTAVAPSATPPPPPLILTSTPTSAPPLPTATQRPAATATATSTPSPTPTVALVSGPKPSDPVGAMDPATADFFPQTGHNIAHGFRDYWHNNGGLTRFGYPLTEEFVENGVTVQYFERARMEYRDGQVGLGRLGAELTQGFVGPSFVPIPFFVSTGANVYFGPTRHSVSGPFLDFWRANGGTNGLGYPLSESYKPDENTEVQWFERGRLEWHRELPAGQRIVLGNIGTEALRARGWLK